MVYYPTHERRHWTALAAKECPVQGAKWLTLEIQDQNCGAK
jgi:hypothetical protein